MELIKLQVEKQNIVSDRQYLVSDTENVYQVEYSFDEEWQGYTKFGVFKQNNVVKQVLLVDDKCQFPNEAITEQGYVAIGVYGVNGDKRYPTIFTSPILVQLGVIEGTQPTPPTPSEWEQIITELSRLEDSIDTLETEIDNVETRTTTLEDDVENLIDDVEALGTTKADKSYVESEIARVEGEIPSIEGLATTDYVDSEIARVEAEIPSIENFATKDELQEVENQIPTKTSDLTNDSGFITSSYHDSTKQDVITDLATIRSGAELGATALQEVPSTYRTSANQDIIDDEIKGDIDDIEAKIPNQATSTNQLADKNFVNSSISTATATFRGTFTDINELQQTSGDLNDYAFLKVMDTEEPTQVKQYDRYKYVDTTPHWVFEYTLNNSSFTSDQWEAINSGITSGLVALIGTALQPSDLTDYVKNTDYATNSKGGVIKTDVNAYGFAMYDGKLYVNNVVYQQYLSRGANFCIGKGTLENVIEGKELQNATQVSEAIEQAIDDAIGEEY